MGVMAVLMLLKRVEMISSDSKTPPELAALLMIKALASSALRRIPVPELAVSDGP